MDRSDYVELIMESNRWDSTWTSNHLHTLHTSYHVLPCVTMFLIRLCSKPRDHISVENNQLFVLGEARDVMTLPAGAGTSYKDKLHPNTKQRPSRLKIRKVSH